MITDLDKLSRALDNSTLSRKLADAVTREKERIDREIAEKGSSIVTVGDRKYRIGPPRREKVAAAGLGV